MDGPARSSVSARVFETGLVSPPHHLHDGWPRFQDPDGGYSTSVQPASMLFRAIHALPAYFSPTHPSQVYGRAASSRVDSHDGERLGYLP